MVVNLEAITDIFVYGDSLLDTGNFLAVTNGLFPPPPYFSGRFSNGPVVIDYLVDRLRRQSDQRLAAVPSLVGGNNYAIAGATTGRKNSNDDNLGQNLPGLRDQIDAFAQRVGTADPNGLYITWAGPNNFLDNLAGSNLEDPADLLEQGVDDFIDSITQLISLGARTVVVPNQLNLGRLPFSAPFRPTATAFTNIFNSRLALSLGNLTFLSERPAFETISVDLFGLGEQIASNPQRFGFTNTSDPLLPLVISGQSAPDTSGFFFWDNFHPTTQAHSLFAQTIFNTLTGTIPQLSFNAIVGTSKSELLWGTRQADNIDGLAGNDTIVGRAGADRIEGWQGNDWLFGNGGDDVLGGGPGVDRIWGGLGADVIFGNAGDDRLLGNRGNDTIVGGLDNDQAWGGAGADFILGGAGTDFLWGNQGKDTLNGGTAEDSLWGGRGADELVGGADHDWLFGGRGNDLLEGSAGKDTLLGGQGIDTARYRSSQDDYIFKGTPHHLEVIGPEGRDTLKSIEHLEFADGSVDVQNLSFLPAPLFKQVQTLEIQIPASGDPADLYIPVTKQDTNIDALPVALVLQGANVDKSNYSEFASVVASYGFAVIVPNNLRSIGPPPPAPSVTGFFPELPQVREVLDYVQDEDAFPVAELVDPEKLVLLGHSFGGAVGLSAVNGACPFPMCPFGEFEQPDELAGAAFFGTNLKPPPTIGGGDIQPIDNTDIPTALIFGSQDGIAAPEATIETYDALQNPPTALVEVAGTNHFGITDSSSPVNPSGTPADVPLIRPDNNPQELPQLVAIDAIATWSAQFLRATVLNDDVAFDFVFGGTGDRLDKNVEVITQPIEDPFFSTPHLLPFDARSVVWSG